MQLSNLNPHIRYARIHKNALGIRGTTHICYDCRLFFFQNITGSIVINGETHSITHNTVIYLPPETQYQFHVIFPENASAIIMNFDLTNEHAHLVSSLGTATRDSFDPSLVLPYTLPDELCKPIILVLPQLSRMLLQCTDHFLHRNPYFRESSSAVLKLCLLELIHQNATLGRAQICEDVLSYIHDHFSEPTLTNKSIADYFNYHPDHLSNLIRQETGRSLHQYLIFYRIQVAKNYLLTTQYDISEIAWRSGFCTAAYFIKIFRRNTGMTPRAYRLHRIHTEI